MNVELVKILTILELTGGKFSRDPAKIKSTVLSSISDYTINIPTTCLRLYLLDKLKIKSYNIIHK